MQTAVSRGRKGINEIHWDSIDFEEPEFDEDDPAMEEHEEHVREVNERIEKLESVLYEKDGRAKA